MREIKQMTPHRHNRKRYASIIHLVLVQGVQVKTAAQRLSMPSKTIYNILSRYEIDFEAQLMGGSGEIWGIKLVDLI